MAGKQPMDDKAFADAVLKALPTAAVPAALQARILADFDRVAARRRLGLRTIRVIGWVERLWPGVPAWQPASVLALSLVLGLTAGAFVPSQAFARQTSDQLVAIADIAAPDTDVDKDL